MRSHGPLRSLRFTYYPLPVGQQCNLSAPCTYFFKVFSASYPSPPHSLYSCFPLFSGVRTFASSPQFLISWWVRERSEHAHSLTPRNSISKSISALVTIGQNTRGGKDGGAQRPLLQSCVATCVVKEPTFVFSVYLSASPALERHTQKPSLGEVQVLSKNRAQDRKGNTFC